MLGKLFAFVFLLFCSSFATPVPVVLGLNSGSILINENTKSHNMMITFSSSQPYLTVKFTVSGIPIPYTLLQVQTTDPGVRSAKSLIDLDPNNAPTMDLEGMYVNRPQYINVLLTSSVNMYFRITDFTPDELKNNTISYILDISLATQKRCPSCVQGHQSPSQTTCQCLPCASNYQGNDCGILVTPLVFGTVVEKKVTGPTYLFFSSSAQVDTVFTVQKNSSSNAYCMVKYKNFSDELAAYPNVQTSGKYMSVYTVSSILQLPLSPQTSTYGASIGIFLYSSQTVVLQALAQQFKASPLLAIILGVLGGILGLAVLIAIIVGCIIARRVRSEQQQIHFAHITHIMQSEENKLTLEEIGRYFPPVQLKEVLAVSADSSSLNIQTRNIDLDCVICLCPVQPEEYVRVAYCQHLFHSECLINWFKKQPNCPYCRQQFQRNNTLEMYTRLCKNQGNQKLTGVQLCKSILEKKLSQIDSNDDLKQP